VPSDRQIRRLLLSGLVADIHKRSRGTYEMLRIRAALMREQNMIVNKKVILSIMRELGIKGLPGPNKRRGPGPAELHGGSAQRALAD
jgi:putative transposase